MFTIWDDLADEGGELVPRLHEHPVILAERVAVTEYRGVRRLATRYSSTISINPSYSQATALMDWSQDNERMLMTCTLRSSSTSSSALNLAPVEDEIVSISAIPTMTLTHELLPVSQLNRTFGHKLFKIQLHKPPFRIPDQKINTLAISSFSEKEPMFFGRSPTPTFSAKGVKSQKRICRHQRYSERYGMCSCFLLARQQLLLLLCLACCNLIGLVNSTSRCLFLAVTWSTLPLGYFLTCVYIFGCNTD